MDSTPEAVVRFSGAAHEFCALVEGAHDRGDVRDEYVLKLRAALADLVAAAFRLPDIEPSDSDVPTSISHEQWQSVFAALQAQLGVISGGPETTMTVTDALADVWRDLREGLDALDAGHRWEDVAWEWRFGLQTHWGRHAVDALAALHDA